MHSDLKLFSYRKGHIPAQLLSVFYGLGQFAAYDQLNRAGRHIKVFGINEHSDIRHFVCGGIAGAIGNTVSTPFDVVRTRIIAQDHGRGYSSMTEVCVDTKRPKRDSRPPSETDCV